MRIWVVLPAYNEAANIPAVFEGFHHLVRDTHGLELNILLIDDASTDCTVKLARECAGELPVTVLHNPVNLGLDGTFMRGIQAANECAADDDIIVCMDSDNTHLASQMLHMARSIYEGRDVVIASRYHCGSVVRGVSLFRRFLSGGMSLLFRAVYPIPGVRDYSCGYRAYHASFLKDALRKHGKGLFAMGGFACMVSILLKLHKEGAICGEVPIVLHYDQKKGDSKMRIGSTITSTIGVLLHERFRRR